jgi:hypothetical protein
MSFCDALVCLVGEKVLPATSRNWSSSRILPPSAAIATSTEASILSAAKASVITTAEAVVFFDRFLATSNGMTHLFAVRALDPGPVLRCGAVSATIHGIWVSEKILNTTEHETGKDIRMAHLIAVAALDGCRVARLVTLFRNVIFATTVLARRQ